MASTTGLTIINAAELVQGIVLVTIPAASTIFTDTSEYGLSTSQYGAMFLPQVALAIATSLLGAGLARRISAERVYLLGLACSTVSMVLLLASTLVKRSQAAAYPMLLVATRQAAPNSCKRSSRYRAQAQNRSWKPCPNRTADRPAGPRSWLGLVLCRRGRRWHDRAYLETCRGWRRHAEPGLVEVPCS